MRKEKVKVTLWGFGTLGKGIAKLLLEKEGFQIVGVCDFDPILVNQDMIQILGMDGLDHPPVLIQKSIDAVVQEKSCDVAIIAIEEGAQEILEKVKWLVEKKVNVITTAEEFVYLKANFPDEAKAIDRLAKANGVTVLGTRVNPGMMMDGLVLFMTGVMQDINKITVKRVSSLSPFSKNHLATRGIGLSVDEFRKRMDNGYISAPVGLKESTYMIAEGLGLRVESYEDEVEPIITDIDREAPQGKARRGEVAGIYQTSKAMCDDGHTSIQLYLSQQIEPEEAGVLTGDYIYIDGVPAINLAIRPEVNGGPGTVALCVNMIPHVINAKPGLKTMLDLPIPRAIIGDVREMIDEDQG